MNKFHKLTLIKAQTTVPLASTPTPFPSSSCSSAPPHALTLLLLLLLLPPRPRQRYWPTEGIFTWAFAGLWPARHGFRWHFFDCLKRFELGSSSGGLPHVIRSL